MAHLSTKTSISCYLPVLSGRSGKSEQLFRHHECEHHMNSSLENLMVSSASRSHLGGTEIRYASALKVIYPDLSTRDSSPCSAAGKADRNRLKHSLPSSLSCLSPEVTLLSEPDTSISGGDTRMIPIRVAHRDHLADHPFTSATRNALSRSNIDQLINCMRSPHDSN